MSHSRSKNRSSLPHFSILKTDQSYRGPKITFYEIHQTRKTGFDHAFKHGEETFSSRDTQKKNFLSPQRESNPWPFRYRLDALTTESPVAQWLERPTGIWKVMGSTPVGGSENSFSECFDLRTLLHYLPRRELKIRSVADYFWRTSRKSQYWYWTGTSLQLRLMCWVFSNANDINCNLFSMKLPHMSLQFGSSPIPRVRVLPINRSLQFHLFKET